MRKSETIENSSRTASEHFILALKQISSNVLETMKIETNKRFPDLSEKLNTRKCEIISGIESSEHGKLFSLLKVS